MGAARNNPKKAEPGQKAKDRAEDRATKAAEAEEARKAAEEAANAPAECEGAIRAYVSVLVQKLLSRNASYSMPG